MRIVPDSTVNLYANVDIDMGSGVQIAFSSIANQRSYFNSKIVRTNTPCTVIKKTGRLRLEVTGSVVSGCNYISFVNPSFDNKTIYARITDYEYINNECTEISYLIDFWQTWMFDVSYERCGIARQYLNETDYTKAVANPYDPSIYAFQTSETLPVEKTMEKLYSYDCTNDGTADSQDGDYMFMSHNIGNSNIADYLKGVQGVAGDSNSFTTQYNVYFIAPFTPPSVTNWDALLSQIIGAGGWVSEPNSREAESLANNTRVHGYFYSNFAKPYYILAIGSNRDTIQDTLIDYLTEWSVIDNIIAIYNMPIQMFVNSMNGIADVDLEESSMTNYDSLTHLDYTYKTSYANRANQTYAPHCQKLYTSPYSYFRMENPSGDAKEFRFEDFVDIRGGSSNTAKFRAIMDLNCKPSLVVMPYKYKFLNNIDASISGGTNYHPAISANFNLLERMEFKEFPQVPYVTDGYLAYLASEVNRSMGSYTANAGLTLADQYAGAAVDKSIYENQMKGTNWNWGGNTIGSASDIAGKVAGKNYAGAGSAGAGFIGSGYSYLATQEGNRKGIELANDTMTMAENNIKLNTSAGHDFLGGNKGALDYMYGMTKSAHAQDIYYAGTQGGLYNYLCGTSIIDIRMTRVWLKDSILKAYDEYFLTYGYNVTGLIDIPYVIKYTLGQSGNDNLPHWEQVNGKYSTYVQTQDCHVTHSMLPVANTIEAMFNSGVRMLKGETL